MAELLGLAATCFLAATLLPFPSEAALLAYLHLRPGHAAPVTFLAFLPIIGDGSRAALLGDCHISSPAESAPCACLHRISWPRLGQITDSFVHSANLSQDIRQCCG